MTQSRWGCTEAHPCHLPRNSACNVTVSTNLTRDQHIRTQGDREITTHRSTEETLGSKGTFTDRECFFNIIMNSQPKGFEISRFTFKPLDMFLCMYVCLFPLNLRGLKSHDHETWHVGPLSDLDVHGPIGILIFGRVAPQAHAA